MQLVNKLGGLIKTWSLFRSGHYKVGGRTSPRELEELRKNFGATKIYSKQTIFQLVCTIFKFVCRDLLNIKHGPLVINVESDGSKFCTVLCLCGVLPWFNAIQLTSNSYKIVP